MELVLATRKSKLAQVQTDRVSKLLKDKLDIDSKKLLMVTEGDRRLDVTLDKIGGKGLFVKDIEIALLEGRADAAIHSMKDVPYELQSDFELIAIPEREDVRDAFISLNGIKIKDLRKGARIGTSSIRRAEQLKIMRPDFEIIPIRGNVQTRLEKMKLQQLDGIILAAAGLKRLGLNDIITDYFNPMEFLPAVGQGALGIEVVKGRKSNIYFESLDNAEIRLQVEAERSFMRELNGGCHSLIGIYSELKGSDLYMIGTFNVNGNIIKKDIVGDKKEHIEIGRTLGLKIKNS